MRTLRLLAVALTAVLLTTSCSGEPADSAASTNGKSDAQVLDVRTPEEYVERHLDGAINLDINSGDFENAVSAYDVDDEYIVYCRSGNRSAQAVTLMESLGFHRVTDAGSMRDAATLTGREIVTSND